MGQTPHFVDALDEQSVATLSTMIGKEWVGFYAWEAPAARNHFSAWDSIGLQLVDECVRINTEILDLPLYEDFYYDVGHLGVDTVRSWSSGEEDVALHKFFAGQLIREIKVARVNVRYFVRELAKWTLSTVWGVVFLLDSGVVAVVKDSYQGFRLRVLTADSVDNLDVHLATLEWTDDDSEADALAEKFETELAFISVQDLMGD